MHSTYRNSYIQTRSGKVNPRVINRAVDLARNQKTIDEFELEPPYLRLTSEHPCIPIENVDVTRRPLAFGRWAMPKLRRELHDNDNIVVLQAVNSILDLVHDPERGYEAIQLRIPDRMVDLLINGIDSIRERVCMALTTIAGLLDGKEAIVHNTKFTENLGLLVEDFSDAVRIKGAALLEMLGRTWKIADVLVEYGMINVLLDNLLYEKEEIVVIHLDSLISMMYGEGKDQALNLGAFNIFVSLIESGNATVKSKAAFCLALLASTRSGKEIAYDVNILPRLNVLLHYEEPEIYSSAAAAIMFCTIKNRSKLKARDVRRLPDRLVQLTKDRLYPSAQIFALKALTNICENPAIRKEVVEVYQEDIEAIAVEHDEDLKRHRHTLITVLGL